MQNVGAIHELPGVKFFYTKDRWEIFPASPSLVKDGDVRHWCS
jgi:hypothetical protein